MAPKTPQMRHDSPRGPQGGPRWLQIASRGAAQGELRWPQEDPKESQHDPKMLPRWPSVRPRWLKMGPRWSKMTPTGPQDDPKTPLEDPRKHPREPNGTPKSSNMDQDGAQRVKKDAKVRLFENTKKRWVLHVFGGSGAPSCGHVGVKMAHWRCM